MEEPFLKKFSRYDEFPRLPSYNPNKFEEITTLIYRKRYIIYWIALIFDILFSINLIITGIQSNNPGSKDIIGINITIYLFASGVINLCFDILMSIALYSKDQKYGTKMWHAMSFLNIFYLSFYLGWILLGAKILFWNNWDMVQHQLLDIIYPISLWCIYSVIFIIFVFLYLLEHKTKREVMVI